MWYVSFHGSSKNSDGAVNNIWRYDDSGNLKQKGILPETSKVTLRELRGFQFVGERLFVVNANKQQNQVLVYQDTGNHNFEFVEVYASAATVNSILHPYDVFSCSKSETYVSNQDTNVVTGLSGKDAAMNVASYLQKNYSPAKNFYQGTMVASSVSGLSGTPTPYPPEVKLPQGLDVSFSPATSKDVANSVRGILAINGYLYVADEVANSVKVYLIKTGELCAEIKGNGLQAPVQLILNNEKTALYIGSSGNGSVYCWTINNKAIEGTIEPEMFINDKIKHISGMAFDANGNFYGAERKKQKILKFASNGSGSGIGSGQDFIKELPDNPEFIRYR